MYHEKNREGPLAFARNELVDPVPESLVGMMVGMMEHAQLSLKDLRMETKRELSSYELESTDEKLSAPKKDSNLLRLAT